MDLYCSCPSINFQFNSFSLSDSFKLNSIVLGGGILELLESFVQNVIRCDDWNDIGGTETVRDARRKKILYLKSLAFQTAAFLNWNLDEMSQ